VQGINDVGYCVPFAYTSTLGFGTTTAFSPSSLTGMRLWLDAQDASKVTLGSGSTITGLTDKSASGFVFSNVSGYGYTPSSFNTSYPSFTAPGASGNSLGTNASFTLSNPNTVFFVGKNDKAFDIYSFIYNTPQNNHTVFMNAGGIGKYSMYAGGVSQADNLSITGTDRSNIIISAIFNGAASAFVQNGSTITSGFNPGTSNITGGLVLGQWYIKDDKAWGGKFCEMMMYSNVLTPFDRQKVEGYLGWKWGLQGSLPATHPFKAAAPVNTTVFSPSTFGGLQIWYDAADPLGTGAAPSNGTSITTWYDKSGRSNNATAGTAASYVTDAAGNYLSFNGSNTYYNIGSGAFIANQPYNIFIIERLQNISGSQVSFYLSGSNATNNTNLLVRYYNNTGNFNWDQYGNFVQGTVTTFTSNAAQPTRMYSLMRSNTGRNILLNGSTIASDSNTTLLSSWNGATLGASAETTPPQYFYSGHMKEVLIYTGNMSTDDRQTVEGYLAWKWGLQGNLPLTHPYLLKNPGSVGTIPVATSSLLVRFDATTYSGSGTWSNTGNLGAAYNAAVENGTPSKNGAGNGIVLNGATNFNFSSLGTVANYTATVWFKRTATQANNNAAIVCDNYTGSVVNMAICTNCFGGTGNTQFIGGFFNGTAWTNGTPQTFTTNQWVSMTTSWDGANFVTYINGTAVNTSNYSGRTASSSGGAYRIGRGWDTWLYVTGEIGQVLIYNRPLTASEVAQNYAATSNTFTV
jgi:hypothetical protein